MTPSSSNSLSSAGQEGDAGQEDRCRRYTDQGDVIVMSDVPDDVPAGDPHEHSEGQQGQDQAGEDGGGREHHRGRGGGAAGATAQEAYRSD